MAHHARHFVDLGTSGSRNNMAVTILAHGHTGLSGVKQAIINEILKIIVRHSGQVRKQYCGR
jgi:hypothetical protein